MRIPASRASDKQLDLFDTERLRPQTSTLARSGIKKSVKPAPDAIHPSAPMTSLPTIRAAQLADVQESVPEWMIEGLWGAEAVGVIGGEPKQGKTFLALDMAIAVASGAPCLRYFPTRRTGPVLLYAAEDSHRVLCQRLQGIAAAAGVDFETLDIHIIATPTLRIDRVDQQRALRATVAQLRPALLSLDPLVRLHAGDENVSREIAALLGYLRSLQREFHTAVVLVHHARKNAAHERGGQALRGSSDLHAWGDSNIYVRRNSKGSISTSSIAPRPAPTSYLWNWLPNLRCSVSASSSSRTLRPMTAGHRSSGSRGSWLLRHSPSPNGNCGKRSACAPVSSPMSSSNSSPMAASPAAPTVTASPHSLVK